MSGTIAIPSGSLARYPAFTRSLANLWKPYGTKTAIETSLSLPRNLNRIIRDMDGDWLWFQSDDHVFQPDLLHRLLAHDRDVVVPLVCQRRPPFELVVYKLETPDGYLPWSLTDLPDKGLVEVHAAGTGGMLVRRRVLDAIGDPWFSYQEGERVTEDLDFCRKVKAAGYSIWADVEARMGHCGIFVAWPSTDGSVSVDMGNVKNAMTMVAA